MRVLVTGVSGFSGAHVARLLASQGHSVTGVHRRETPFLSRLRGIAEIELVRGALEQSAELPGPFDAVVHVAATSPAPGVDVQAMVRDNVSSTLALIEAAVGWKSRSFVFFSSLSVFGEVTVPVVDESCPILNPDPYGATKYLGEQLLLERSDVLPSLSIRLPGVIGPGAHRNWLSSVAVRLSAGDPVAAFNLDGPYNNAAHVDDLARFAAQLLDRGMAGADSVVVGARGQITVRAAIERLAAGLGVRPHIMERDAPRPGFTLSSVRAIERWGYDPLEIGAMIDRYAAEILAERKS